MRSLILASLAAVVAAHFQLQFPDPRGVFDEGNEGNFCDGYNTPASNRTEFPLQGGFVSLNSEHEDWAAGVFLATTSNPVVKDFKQIVPFFSVKAAEGPFCFPLLFTSSNATGLTNGQNVTILVSFDGGDGSLFQCSDLTLSDSFKIASDVSCTNSTGGGSSTSGGSSTTGGPATTTTSTTPAGGQTGQPGSGSKAGGVTVLVTLISIVGSIMLM